MKEKHEFYEKVKEKAYKLFEEGKKVKEIAKYLNADRHAIGRYLRKKGYKYSFYNKVNIDSTIFNSINTEEKAYWLGFLYADGNVSSINPVYKGSKNTIELCLANKDLNHLEKFKIFLNYEGKIAFREKTNSNRISFRDVEIHSNLIELGCIPNKSLILKFPTEEQVPKHLIHHFIRGYFDGDGFIRKKESPIEISILGTLEFLTSLKEISNLKNKLLKKDKRHINNTYNISLSGDSARNFGKFIYKNATLFLERKFERFIHHLNKIK